MLEWGGVVGSNMEAISIRESHRASGGRVSPESHTAPGWDRPLLLWGLLDSSGGLVSCAYGVPRVCQAQYHVLQRFKRTRLQNKIIVPHVTVVTVRL